MSSLTNNRVVTESIRRIVAEYLRLARKPRMATEESARATLALPKRSPNPPGYVYRRNEVRADMIDGFPVFEVVAKGNMSPSVAVIHVHGGGFYDEIVPQHWEFINKLAQKAGCRVIVPVYGLAPEHTYKEAFTLLGATYDRILESHAAENVSFVGDSAGGGLALAFAQTLIPTKMPGRLILIAPWLDLTMSNPELKHFAARDPWLSLSGLHAAQEAWAGGADPGISELSPIYGNLHGLPPVDLYVGTNDILYPDVMKLAKMAQTAGVDVSTNVVEGAVHVYPLISVLPEGRHASDQIARTIGGLI